MKVDVGFNGLEHLSHTSLGRRRGTVLVSTVGVSGTAKDGGPLRVNLDSLWVGNELLRTEEVVELRDRLGAWLQTGSLRLEGEKDGPTEGHGSARKEEEEVAREGAKAQREEGGA